VKDGRSFGGPHLLHWAWHAADVLRQVDHDCGAVLAAILSHLRVCAVLVGGSRGQASMEAALLLPSVSLVVVLLVQPVCLSYTRMLMRSAAVDAARCAATATGGMETCQDYARRRLRAVPEVPLFHVGGETDWQISVASSDGQVSVSITGHARPLPLMGSLAALAGMSDGTGVVLRAEVTEQMRPTWVKGGYDAWQQIWG
jgi:hypothetical protein